MYVRSGRRRWRTRSGRSRRCCRRPVFRRSRGLLGPLLLGGDAELEALRLDEKFLLAGCGQLVFDKHTVTQSHGDVADLRLGAFGVLRQRLDAAVEHGGAERAGGGDFLGAGVHGLFGAEFVDALADVLLHEHAGAAGATAEGLVAGLVHLAQLDAGRAQQLTRRVEDLVVAAQEAGVVVGDRLALIRGTRNRGQPLVAHQPVEQLRVVEDVVVAVKVRVLVADGVEAVRASGDDLALALRYAVEDSVERVDVLGGLHLEEELVARAARRVAGAGFAGGQHHVLHAGGV